MIRIKACVFLFFDKNTDALFCIRICAGHVRFCLATIGADVFLVRQLRLAHFLFFERRTP
jgi:hypothetical protein